MEITKLQFENIVEDVLTDVLVEMVNERFWGRSDIEISPDAQKKLSVLYKNQIADVFINNKLEFYARKVQLSNDNSFAENFKQLDAYVTYLNNHISDMKKKL